jgi:formylglycine-generating enzyme required for sulfatase activity
MNTMMIRWFSLALLIAYLLPGINKEHIHSASLVQIYLVYLPLMKNDPTYMAYVPEGEFLMGCYPAPGTCNPDDEHLHAVWLDAYFIDLFEVTNAQFAKCVEAGGCSAPSSFNSNTHQSYYGNPAFAKYPVIYSTWEDAQNYCQWQGKRLPTEAEWEKAARGVSDTRFFPWGNQLPDCTLANFYNIFGNGSCMNDTTQVGSYPSGSSPYGLLDMAGNVAEWVSDWYDPYYYIDSPYMNPTGPTSGTEKVLRGGSWNSNWFILQVTYRWPQDPGSEFNIVGIRCAFTH